MATVRKRLKRVIRSPSTQKPMTRVEQPNYSTATLRIMELPEFIKIVEALRKGTSVPFIVRWFEREGWLGNMSPSTFTQYLYKFKVERKQLLEGTPKDTDSYDAYVGTNIPEVDEEQELDKLIMLQKRRISRDVQTELSIGKLLDNTHKEVNSLAELLRLKRNMKSGDGGGSGISSVSDSTQLREMRVSESEQDKMQEHVVRLFEAVKNNAPAKKTRKAQKARA